MLRENISRFLVLGLLLVSIALLSVLIPGGPIENRDFSDLGPATVLLFNIFLVGLLIAALISVIMVWCRQRHGSTLSLLTGCGFVLVYLADLLEIFPVSPTPMSSTLYSVEMSGLCVGIILMLSARLAAFRSSEQIVEAHLLPSMLTRGKILATLGLIALIVIFATFSALTPQP